MGRGREFRQRDLTSAKPKVGAGEGEFGGKQVRQDGWSWRMQGPGW